MNSGSTGLVKKGELTWAHISAGQGIPIPLSQIQAMLLLPPVVALSANSLS